MGKKAESILRGLEEYFQYKNLEARQKVGQQIKKYQISYTWSINSLTFLTPFPLLFDLTSMKNISYEVFFLKSLLIQMKASLFPKQD